MPALSLSPVTHLLWGYLSRKVDLVAGPILHRLQPDKSTTMKLSIRPIVEVLGLALTAAMAVAQAAPPQFDLLFTGFFSTGSTASFNTFNGPFGTRLGAPIARQVFPVSIASSSTYLAFTAGTFRTCRAILLPISFREPAQTMGYLRHLVSFSPTLG